jgi:hypothetical protein
VLEFFLYFNDQGRCVLKQLNEPITNEFSDILGALMFIRHMDPHHTASLTVFDTKGHVLFEDLLSDRSFKKLSVVAI